MRAMEHSVNRPVTVIDFIDRLNREVGDFCHGKSDTLKKEDAEFLSSEFKVEFHTSDICL